MKSKRIKLDRETAQIANDIGQVLTSTSEKLRIAGRVLEMLKPHDYYSAQTLTQIGAALAMATSYQLAECDMVLNALFPREQK